MEVFNDIKRRVKRKFIYRLDYTGERVVPTEMHGDVSTWIRHLSRYVFSLNYVVRKNTLDVACGTGYGVSILSSVATSVTGIDNNPHALNWAKRHNKFYCPVKFIIKDVETEHIPGTFESVVSFETIEHLNNPRFFLTNVKRILKPNGTFIFSVPLNDPPNKFHHQRFNWESIEKLIKSSVGTKIKWYSQFDYNFIEGKKSNAKFGIGIYRS